MPHHCLSSEYCFDPSRLKNIPYSWVLFAHTLSRCGGILRAHIFISSFNFIIDRSSKYCRCARRLPQQRPQLSVSRARNPPGVMQYFCPLTDRVMINNSTPRRGGSEHTITRWTWEPLLIDYGDLPVGDPGVSWGYWFNKNKKEKIHRQLNQGFSFDLLSPPFASDNHHFLNGFVSLFLCFSICP